MRVAYLDCFSGISGDMMLGALLDAGMSLDVIQTLIDDIGLASCKVVAQPVMRAGIAATKATIEGELDHVHSPAQMLALFDHLSCSEHTKERCKQVFLTLAQAEATVHKRDLDKVHLHELGSLDTLIDIAGSVVGLDSFGIERVHASNLNVGGGTVMTAHGRLPVPAPATAAILKSMPVFSSGAEAELTTPTGAALARNLVDVFGPLPKMKLEHIGYGAGDHELEQANVVRLMVGETDGELERQTVSIIETNIDDMNPEFYGYVMGVLQEEGALDVYLVPCHMKKNRPGTLLCVVCSCELEQKLVSIILRETTTLGIRVVKAERKKLSRQVRTIVSSLGEVRVKIAREGDRIVGFAPEYEDCRVLAETTGRPLRQVYDTIKAEAAIILQESQ